MTRKLSKRQISYRLGLRYAQKYVEEFLKGKQNPDKVNYRKQWNEFGQLKGWMIGVYYEGVDSELEIILDLTPYYGRIIGDIKKIPEYIPGKHQYWDYDKEKHGSFKSDILKAYEKLL